MKVCYFTHKGKVRQNNEDGLLIGRQVFVDTSFDKIECNPSFDGNFLCVVDGIGGYEGGETASKIILETLSNYQPTDGSQLIKALKEAKENLSKKAEESPNLTKMGGTLAGIILLGDSLTVFNVGDCRVYRVFKDKVVRLSRDHSVVEDLVLQGLISREEAKHHPKRNIITSAVTVDSDFEIFLRDLESFEDDRFVICSDGLWEEREDFYQLFNNPEEFIKQLFNNHRLKDNFSFISLEVE